jgi:chemotaxis protein MotB
MARKEEPEKDNAERWLLTYADMITLLMLFFIILYSMSTVDAKKFEQLAVGLEAAFSGGSSYIFPGASSGGKGMMEFNGKYASGKRRGQETRPSVKLKKTKALFKTEIEARNVMIREDERGLVITLASDMYFEQGSAALDGNVRGVLKKVSTVVNSMPNFVRIEGHTDNANAGVKSGYETNWELSSARSINVLRYMIQEQEVNPKKLSAVAFGESRPIDDNDTVEGKAYNRRVDIVILNEKILDEKSSNPKIERPLPDEEWR